MSAAPPVIALRQITKDHGGDQPLRLDHLHINAGDRIILSGLDRAAAETVVHLVSGAALPDAGEVIVAGINTRTIATDTDWLVSLDRFGIVTHRAVLLDNLPVAANLALPLTLAIDPMSPEVRASVEDAADLAQLPREALDKPVASLSPLARLRLHLARALMLSPQLLLLEHPTVDLTSPDEAASFGETLRTAADVRKVGWLALSNDDRFAKAAGGTRLRVDGATGVVGRTGWSGFWRFRS